MVSTDQCYKNQSRIQSFRKGAGGGGEAQSSGPWENGGQSQTKLFRPFEPQFGLKLKGGQARRAPPLNPPLNMSIYL